MYRRPKFLEVLLEIRREMSLQADYDVELFSEIVRSGIGAVTSTRHSLAPNGESDRAGRDASLKPARKARKV